MHTHPGGGDVAAGANTDKLLILMRLFSQNQAMTEALWFGRASVKNARRVHGESGPHDELQLICCAGDPLKDTVFK